MSSVWCQASVPSLAQIVDLVEPFTYITLFKYCSASAFKHGLLRKCILLKPYTWKCVEPYYTGAVGNPVTTETDASKVSCQFKAPSGSPHIIFGRVSCLLKMIPESETIISSFQSPPPKNHQFIGHLSILVQNRRNKTALGRMRST